MDMQVVHRPVEDMSKLSSHSVPKIVQCVVVYLSGCLLAWLKLLNDRAQLNLQQPTSTSTDTKSKMQSPSLRE